TFTPGRYESMLFFTSSAKSSSTQIRYRMTRSLVETSSSDMGRVILKIFSNLVCCLLMACRTEMSCSVEAVLCTVSLSGWISSSTCLLDAFLKCKRNRKNEYRAIVKQRKTNKAREMFANNPKSTKLDR